MIDAASTAEDYFGLDEQSEIKWMAVLSAFNTDIWPMFQRHGYTRAEAFQIWQLNAIKNSIYTLQNILLGEKEDDGDGIDT
jgi:hypothetical protein